ncbi:MAG TPA: multicopper oxidase domain-containing protein [Acidimicrobiales bacterium]|nr:multicopper oxidase domain-containing protein [Acidimicrobiales bacterium]
MRQAPWFVDRLQVRPGTTVRFQVRNTDPIAHELIIGDGGVHHRHATGTEAIHPPVPGEVSVRPHESGLTTYTFDQPGTVVFACHLPGHLDYGMKGVVVVTDD